MLSCELVRRKVALSFHGKCVTNCLDLFLCYSVIRSVDRRLDFILIRGSLKVSTKAPISIVVTVWPIALTSTSVTLANNVHIRATVLFSASRYSSV